MCAAKVLFIGDSRKMKGGVSSVMQNIEKSRLWRDWDCYWIENQINKNVLFKLIYLIKGLFYGLILIPRYSIVHFQTAPGRSLIINLPLLLYALLWRRKIVTQLHVGNQIEEYLNDFYLKYWVKHSNLVLLLGKKWRDVMCQRFQKGERFEYIYNPVEMKNDNRLSPRRYFLYAAYFDTNKGAAILLEAFSEIVKDFPDWKLVMCGDGDKETIKSLLIKHNLSESVIMPGWVSGKEKEYYFKNAYAYCMTSYKEGLPMSVLEAMAYGIPIITTPVGCLPEIVVDGQSCLSFDFGDARQLADQMKKLICDKELRQVLSAESYNIAYNNFSIDIIACRLDSFYRSLLLRDNNII